MGNELNKESMMECRRVARMTNTVSELLKRAGQARRDDRPDDALRDYAEAVALCRELGVQRDLIRALKGLGQIERDLGNTDAALTLYEEAVEFCREEGDELLLAHTIRHVGDIHQDTGRLDLAEPCYVEALAIYRSNDDTWALDLANTVRPFAILKEAVGQPEDAKRLWEEARDLYAAVGVPEGVTESAERLARLNA